MLIRLDFGARLNPLATMVAAFAGACFAFLFESRRKAKEEKNQQRAIANRSIYVISEMWNVLYQYYQNIAKPIQKQTRRMTKYGC